MSRWAAGNAGDDAGEGGRRGGLSMRPRCLCRMSTISTYTYIVLGATTDPTTCKEREGWSGSSMRSQPNYRIHHGLARKGRKVSLVPLHPPPHTPTSLQQHARHDSWWAPTAGPNPPPPPTTVGRADRHRSAAPTAPQTTRHRPPGRQGSTCAIVPRDNAGQRLWVQPSKALQDLR